MTPKIQGGSTICSSIFTGFLSPSLGNDLASVRSMFCSITSDEEQEARERAAIPPLMILGIDRMDGLSSGEWRLLDSTSVIT